MRMVSASGTINEHGWSSSGFQRERIAETPFAVSEAAVSFPRQSNLRVRGPGPGGRGVPEPGVHGAGRSSPSVRAPAPSQRQRRPIACETPAAGVKHDLAEKTCAISNRRRRESTTRLLDEGGTTIRLAPE
jgi:hypothetical protein